jgi:hypothetical protein
MRPRLLVALAISLCLVPSGADAHMVWAGGGAFWAGFLHPLTSLDEICFLVSLSIWSTFNEPSTRLWVLGTIGAVTTVAAVIPLVEWAGAFHDSCHGHIDDCERPRGSYSLQSPKRNPGPSRCDRGVVHRLRDRTSGGRLVTRGVHYRRFAQSNNALPVPSDGFGATEVGMAKYCQPSCCELDRRNRNYDVDLRARAAPTPDAASLAWHFFGS